MSYNSNLTEIEIELSFVSGSMGLNDECTRTISQESDEIDCSRNEQERRIDEDRPVGKNIRECILDVEFSDPRFTVSFTKGAIKVMKEVGEYLEIHSPFRMKVDYFNPLQTELLEREFEQKLGMYISVNIKYRVENSWRFIINSPVDNYYIVTESDIISEISTLMKHILNKSFLRFPEEHMINGYPLLILSQVCKTTLLNAHVMGESVKRFIELRKTYPNFRPTPVLITIEGNCKLVGEEGSPLNQEELYAIYRYLGTRRNIYVNILLNCLFELSQHEKSININQITQDDIIKLCKSSWLYLFFCASATFI